MILSTAAYNELTKSYDEYPRMVNDDPVIPDNQEFTPSASGNELYYQYGDNYAIIIVLPIEGVREGAVYKLFCKRGSRSESNFTKLEDAVCLSINGTPIRSLDCGEQLFKLYCVFSHIHEDPVWDMDIKSNRLAALSTILTASTPEDAKFATGKGKLVPFRADAWDKLSFQAMLETQKWKATSSKIHAELKYLASLASKHSIPLGNIFFMECGDPKKSFRDFIWGSGLTAEEAKCGILSEPNWPWGDSNVTDTIHASCPYSGGNALGRALQLALRFVLGDNGEFLDESVEDYRTRFGTEIPLVSYTPVPAFVQEGPVVEPIHLLRLNTSSLPLVSEEDSDVLFVREERCMSEIKRTRSDADSDTSLARAPSFEEDEGDVRTGSFIPV